MNIGATIKKLRKRKNIRQLELAEKSGISQTYLSQIETGERIPTIESLEKICLVLKIPFPILSFLSLDPNSVQKEKRDAFMRIEPAIKAMVEEFFMHEKI